MTRKEIYNIFNKVYYVGYCDLQHLLRNKNRIGYNSGIYGWNYDVFSFGDIAICTGYRGMPGVRIPSELRNKYETKARELTNSNVKYDEYEKQLEILQYDFISELKEG